MLSEAEASVRKTVNGDVRKTIISGCPSASESNRDAFPGRKRSYVDENIEQGPTNVNSTSVRNSSIVDSNVRPNSKHCESKKKRYHWVKKDIPQCAEKEFVLPQWLEESTGDPVELFELYYDTDICDMIAKYTNLYAFQKGKPNLFVTPNEIKVFLAILLVSGYCQVPRFRMYWEESPDSHNEAISRAMSRNRFVQIMTYLHVCDNNNLDITDRFAKVVEFSPLGKNESKVEKIFP